MVAVSFLRSFAEGALRSTLPPKKHGENELRDSFFSHGILARVSRGLYARETTRAWALRWCGTSSRSLQLKVLIFSSMSSLVRTAYCTLAS